MSSALRTKLAAIMSIPFFRPKSRMSDSSFSVSVGRSTMHPGRLMFLFSPNVTLRRIFTLMLAYTYKEERNKKKGTTFFTYVQDLDDFCVYLCVLDEYSSSDFYRARQRLVVAADESICSFNV
jgi:hypothetical protein